MSENSPLFRLEPAVAGRDHECRAFAASFTTTAALIYGACITVGLGILLACTQEIAHKSTIPGRTALLNGDLKLYPDNRRRLTELAVRVGDRVIAGQPLATLQGLRSFEQRTHAQQRLASLFAEQSRLREALALSEQQQRQETEYRAADEQLVRRNFAVQNKERQALQALLSLSEQQLERGKRLHTNDHLSAHALAELEVTVKEQQRSLAALERGRVLSKQQNLQQAQAFDRQQFAAKENRRQQLAELERLQREITQIEYNERQVLSAPVAGRITGILGNVGATFDPQQPVISMVSEGADFRAELWAPSSAAGSLALGQPVNLLLDAFPHQRHGMLRGTIAHINTSPLTLRELGAPWDAERIAYGVTVDMDSTHPLYQRIKPGMQLTADIKLDNSTLFERLFDPLLSAVERAL